MNHHDNVSPAANAASEDDKPFPLGTLPRVVADYVHRTHGCHRLRGSLHFARNWPILMAMIGNARSARDAEYPQPENTLRSE